MFDKLEDLLVRFEEVLNELGEPGVTDNQERFQKLMKEQSELQPIVDAYKEYKDNKETIQDSLSMLEEEKDEEMREMLKEELSDAKKRVEELEKKLPGKDKYHQCNKRHNSSTTYDRLTFFIRHTMSHGKKDRHRSQRVGQREE